MSQSDFREPSASMVTAPGKALRPNLFTLDSAAAANKTAGGAVKPPPAAPTNAPPAAAPQTGGGDESQKPAKTVIVNVHHGWGPDAVQGPVAYPLKDHLGGKNVHVVKAHLLTTDSQAKGNLYATAADILPRTESEDKNVIANERFGDKPVTYTVPPGHKVHDLTLHENSATTSEETIDLACHARIDPDSLTAGVAAIPGTNTVIVYSSISPKLFEMLEGNMDKFKDARTNSIGGQPVIEINKEELDAFVASYKAKIHSVIPKTNASQHSIQLHTYATGAPFGEAVANMALSGKERSQLLEADTKPHVISRIEYTYIPLE